MTLRAALFPHPRALSMPQAFDRTQSKLHQAALKGRGPVQGRAMTGTGRVKAQRTAHEEVDATDATVEPLWLQVWRSPDIHPHPHPQPHPHPHPHPHPTLTLSPSHIPVTLTPTLARILILTPLWLQVDLLREAIASAEQRAALSDSRAARAEKRAAEAEARNDAQRSVGSSSLAAELLERLKQMTTLARTEAARADVATQRLGLAEAALANAASSYLPGCRHVTPRD